MKKYILISKDTNKNVFTMYESDNYKFIYQKYRLWRSIMPKENFCIFSRIE